MEPNVFAKELQKYKVVRLEDHYKPRMRRNDSAKPKAIADKPTTTKATANVKKAIDGADFWAVIDNALADILTAKEKESFLKNLKKDMPIVQESINLDDLNVAAASLVVK